jgi:hypothetical protein
MGAFAVDEAVITIHVSASAISIQQGATDVILHGFVNELRVYLSLGITSDM